MPANPQLHSECFDYFINHATNLLFILTPRGDIVEANGYAKGVTDRNLTGMNIRDVILDLSGRFDFSELVRENSEEILLSIDSGSDFPQSFYFRAIPVGEYIMLFGRLDTQELQAMQKEILAMNNELNNLTRELHKKNATIQDALDHIKTLQGIIPICMHCHKIRDDGKIWNRIEKYLSDHTEAQLSHSICPECAKKYYPDMNLYSDGNDST